MQQKQAIFMPVGQKVQGIAQTVEKLDTLKQLVLLVLCKQAFNHQLRRSIVMKNATAQPAQGMPIA